MTKPGIYRHFRGAFYLVLDTEIDCTNGSPTEDKLLVSYISLATGHRCSRLEAQFHELVWKETGVKLTDDEIGRYLDADDALASAMEQRFTRRFEFVGHEVPKENKTP